MPQDSFLRDTLLKGASGYSQEPSHPSPLRYQSVVRDTAQPMVWEGAIGVSAHE